MEEPATPDRGPAEHAPPEYRPVRAAPAAPELRHGFRRPSAFRAPWWLRGAHLQTLWATLIRRRPCLELRRERFETDDGDFVDLDWGPGGSGATVLVLHGLEGSSRSPYALGLLAALAAAELRGAVLHFRGCSGEPNRRDRAYHSGDTGDLAHVVQSLRRRGDRPFAAVGFSMGGNVLLKWLAEQEDDAPVTAAVAVSVPYELDKATRRLDRGFSRLYQRHLLASLQDKVARKFRRRRAPFDLCAMRRCRNFWEFDDLVTAPLGGFADAVDYYRRSSSRQYVRAIRAPTLLLHARDDPFMTPDAVPRPEELSSTTTLELSEQGGHVGFVYGPAPWRARYWLEERIVAYLLSRLPPE